MQKHKMKLLWQILITQVFAVLIGYSFRKIHFACRWMVDLLISALHGSIGATGLVISGLVLITTILPALNFAPEVVGLILSVNRIRHVKAPSTCKVTVVEL